MKDFLVLGRCTAMGYKDIHSLILDNKMWFGCTETGKMIGGDVHCYWFTNVVSDKVMDYIPLTRRYEDGGYKKLDFYDAINIDSIYDIPKDYPGVMAVPINFIDRVGDEYELVGAMGCGGKYNMMNPVVDGKNIYARILIRKKS